MDYFTDLFAIFLSLGHVRTLAGYGGSESSHHNISCVQKMNEGLTGLERHEVSN